MGLDIVAAFGERPRSRGRGIGGSSEYFVDDAVLELEHGDGSIVGYRFDEMWIAVPTADNADLPSLLGMDFIGAFEFLLDSNRDRVELR